MIRIVSLQLFCLEKELTSEVEIDGGKLAEFAAQYRFKIWICSVYWTGYSYARVFTKGKATN